MIDAALRRKERDGRLTAKDLMRSGVARVRYGNGHGYGYGYGNGDGHGDGYGDGNGYGNGDGNGNGHGNGNGNGHGHGNGNGDGNGNGHGHGYGYGNGDGDGDGNGDGYGNGHGHGNGNGDGNGNGYGDGNGYGYGDGNGDGNGNGNGYSYGEEALMHHTDLIPLGTPIVVRSYVSGVFVGRLAGGEDGTVAITAWRWLRRWSGVGSAGSVYDLVHSGKAPAEAGPFRELLGVFQQADAMVIDEACYARLAGVPARVAS